MSRAGEAREKLDRAGIDRIVEMIAEEGASLRGIANAMGVSMAAFLAWIEADSDRSARVREVRALMARVWDEKAEDLLSQAGDEFQLKRAKELAHHYRWRASKTAPREYGDKVEVKAAVTLEQLVVAAAGTSSAEGRNEDGSETD